VAADEGGGKAIAASLRAEALGPMVVISRWWSVDQLGGNWRMCVCERQGAGVVQGLVRCPSMSNLNSRTRLFMLTPPTGSCSKLTSVVGTREGGAVKVLVV
jgi:hypothetical protein